MKYSDFQMHDLDIVTIVLPYLTWAGRSIGLVSVQKDFL
jgi:hypothetical protein